MKSIFPTKLYKPLFTDFMFVCKCILNSFLNLGTNFIFIHICIFGTKFTFEKMHIILTLDPFWKKACVQMFCDWLLNVGKNNKEEQNVNK